MSFEIELPLGSPQKIEVSHCAPTEAASKNQNETLVPLAWLKGRALRKRLLRQRQTEVAFAGNPAMLIFLGKQELGQHNAPLLNLDAVPLTGCI